MTNKYFFIMQDISAGGVQKVFITLVNEMASRGEDVTLVVIKQSGEFESLLSSRVSYINLSHKKVLFSAFSLYKLLWKERPDVCVTAIVHVNIFVSIIAKALPFKFKHIITEHTNCTEAQSRAQRNNLKFAYVVQKYFYPSASGFICVSKGVAEDLIKRIPKIMRRVEVIPNPVVTSEMQKYKDCHDEFATKNEIPIILFVGRLVPEKGVDFLIEAFSVVRKCKPCKLIIVGDGPERRCLEKMVSCKGLSADVEFLGYRANPHVYFKRADLFALTSKHEGFALALVEALFFSKRVISVDCPSGPAEILELGRYGRLVERGSPKDFGLAMLEELDKEHDSVKMVKRALDYSSRKIADEYLKVMRP